MTQEDAPAGSQPIYVGGPDIVLSERIQFRSQIIHAEQKDVGALLGREDAWPGQEQSE